MFAVMKTGGKQYRVTPGDVLRVEKLAADAGETVQFNDILMVGGDSVTVGSPMVSGAAVQAAVIDQIKGDKVIHFVKRRRKHSSKRTKGHRQHLTLLRVTEILETGADASGVKAAIGAGSAPDAATVETPAPVKEAAKVKETAPVLPDAATEGSRPDNLLAEARGGQPDDLKKIKGVGPKLEGVLHEIGVFHFDQIAAWGPEDVAYMNDRLSFKGRIERDNWIEKATELAAEKE
ncbi:50S ribosomal protein L21 [Jannaschia sp. LMIT008]|uniref:50S ribosomal protein L21 n=1 Tax=Jannaschia maritima TaxID=3032585 RepID=UPI00281218AE|nr:50S ribosomal protein L21 [Jannaschia sp. LMIT008]